MSTTEALPELPNAAAYIDQSGECSPSLNCHVYTADQMRDYARAALAAAATSQKPFGHFVYIAAEQRGEFVHDLDEAIDDLTNCECEVTDLYEHPAPAGGAEPAADAALLADVNGSEEIDHPNYGGGFFMTPDVFAAVQARLAPTAQPQPEPSQEFNRGWDAAIEANRLPHGAERRQDHDWRPRELQEEHGEVTLPFAEFRRLVAAQPERLPYVSALDPVMQEINASAAQPEAPAEPSDKPLGYVKFRAAQTLQTDGYCDGHEWLEFCEPGELGDDKKPAFAVYASPQAAPVARQPAELTHTQLHDIIGEHLTYAYACTMSWDAWDTGNMSRHDFHPLADTDFQDELATAILKAQGGSQ